MKIEKRNRKERWYSGENVFKLTTKVKLDSID